MLYLLLNQTCSAKICWSELFGVKAPCPHPDLIDMWIYIFGKYAVQKASGIELDCLGNDTDGHKLTISACEPFLKSDKTESKFSELKSGSKGLEEKEKWDKIPVAVVESSASLQLSEFSFFCVEQRVGWHLIVNLRCLHQLAN